MITLSELLDPHPSRLWTLVRQCGVEHAVALLDGGEQHSRWLRADGSNRGFDADGRATPWSREAIAELQQRFADHGLTVIAIEDTPPMDDVRLGGPRAYEQLGHLHEQIRAMGELGIPVLCYNWMAVTSWARTATDIPTRGGALTTGFRAAEAAGESLLPDGLQVTLALHPDDPPLPQMRGVPRIISSPQAYQRILDAHPSPSNGITFCQGNWALMTDDLPGTIRRFLPHIAFVHFRDVAGDASDFVETFHDAGPNDLAQCMRLYVEAGFSGPMRPDHVPTMAGESNDRPGYATLGRLFALGYIRGLEHGVRNAGQQAGDVGSGASRSDA